MIKEVYEVLSGRIKSIHPNINAKIKGSNWYHNVFPHLSEFERLKQGADVLCIGSTPARNAIDFRGMQDVKGYNLAVCPETIFYDFQVLKNYHSYLKANGTVLFVLCPFTFLKDFYRNEFGSKSYLNIRYYPILHRAMIDTFDYKLYHKWVEEPLLIGKDAWKRLIKDAPRSTQMDQKTNPNSIEESRVICEQRVKNWMREFRMTTLNPSDIPLETENAIQSNIEIYLKMKAFIEERGYKATIIIPPFPEEMISLIPRDLINHTLIEPIKKVGLPFINYYGDKDWTRHDLYYHGFLLNSTGRQNLTKDVLTKIEL